MIQEFVEQLCRTNIARPLCRQQLQQQQHTWADVEQDSSSRGRRTLKNNIRTRHELWKAGSERVQPQPKPPPKQKPVASVRQKRPLYPPAKGKEFSLLRGFFERREDASSSASATHDGRRASPEASGTATARIPTTTNARVSLQLVVNSHISTSC